jgi:hypothetical protein
MGLFDKIKDNAKNISVRALEEAEGDSLMVAPESAVAGNGGGDIDASDSHYDGPKETDLSAEEESHDAAVEAPEPKKEAPEAEETSESKYKDTPKPKEEPKKIEPSKPAEQKPKPSETKPSQPKDKPSYQPHYKMGSGSARSVGKSSAGTAKGKFLDVTPAKPPEDPKQAIYARERATLAVLAGQRRMTGEVPLYVTSHLRFKTRVFIDRIEYSGSFGKNVLPIEQVAWVKLRSGGTGIIIETAEGKRVVMVVKPADRLDFADAVLRVQSMQPKREKFKDTKTVRLDQLEQFGEGIDELEKLAKLYEKGILTQEEFEAKKKQILNL